MKRTFVLLLLFVAGLLAGCFQKSHGSRFSIRFDGPSFPTGFQCLGILVTGEGIPAQDNPNGQANWEAIYRGGVCPYAGVSTRIKPVVSGSSTIDFELPVPVGRNRTIQVVGIVNKGDCPSGTVSDLFIANSQKQLSETVVGVYELGRRYLDTYHATSVAIKPSYDATSAKNLLTCDATAGGGGGGQVSELFPFSTLNLFPGDNYYLKPTGGTPPYTFEKISGAGLLSDVTNTSAFVGSFPTDDTTLIRVKDSTGKTADVTLVTSSLVTTGTLKHRFSAANYAPQSDAQSINGANFWYNRGSSSLLLNPPASGDKVVYFRNGGPRGFPAIRFSAGGGFESDPTTDVISNEHSILAVVRQSANAAVSILCMASSTCGTGVFSHLLLGGSPDIGSFSVTDNAMVASTNPTGDYSDKWQLVVAHFSAPSTLKISLKVGATGGTPNTHAVANFVFPSTAIFRLGGIDSSGVEASLEVAELIVIEGSGDTTSLQTKMKEKYGLQ